MNNAPFFKHKNMDIDISYCSIKNYDRTNITQWMWMFKRYKYIKGVKMRILGIYFNIREKNATYKLIKLIKNNMA